MKCADAIEISNLAGRMLAAVDTVKPINAALLHEVQHCRGAIADKVFGMVNDNETVFALLDILDGVQEQDIEAMTGLSPERCTAIASLRSRLYTEHGHAWLNR
jgi:hypothetical protein